MPLPILKIAKVLARLSVLAPAASKTIDTIRALLETPHGDVNTTKQLDDLKQALELQATVNEDIAEQLRLFKSVLEDLQRSLKIWAWVSIGAAIAALAALVMALVK
jgi:hypothetical protein